MPHTLPNPVEHSEWLAARGFLEVLAEEEPEMAVICRKHLQEGLDILTLPFLPDITQAASKRAAIELMALEAKFSDVRKAARKLAAVEAAETLQRTEPDNPDCIHATLAKLREAGLTSLQVQELIDHHARVEISLTGHPVNPRSQDYITLLMKLDEVLENPRATPEDFKRIIRQIIHTPYTGIAKTHEGMTEEALIVTSAIQQATQQVRSSFREALSEAGYPGITLPETLVKVNMWQGGGDGDGNSSMDKSALEQGITASRALATRLNLSTPLAATIDIRHGAEDFMETVAHLLDAAELMETEAFLALTAEAQATHLIQWLEDDSALAALLATHKSSLPSPTARRIAERLEVLAAQPEASDKLIIANMEHPAHLLAAMLSLRSCGVPLAMPASRLHIVPLFESVADLQAMPEIMDNLLRVTLFRRHVTALGNRLILMIAKSDTTRQDGLGATYYQATEPGRAVLELHRQHGVEVAIFHGGGGAITRGGMRLSKNAGMVGSAIARAVLVYGMEACNCGIPEENLLRGIAGKLRYSPVLATVQGSDMQGKFCGVKVASHTLLTTLSQNLLAAAKATLLIPAPDYYGTDTREREHIVIAMQDAGEAFKSAITRYKAYLANGSIDALGERFRPWVTNKSATTSLGTRPAARGQSLPQAGMTAEKIKGKKLRLILDNRAIFVERMLAHEGNVATTYLGQDACFDALREYGHANTHFRQDALAHAYRYDVFFRDYVQRMTEGLFMANFAHNWRLGGMQPPPEGALRQAAMEYSLASPTNSAEATLAHLEERAHYCAARCYEAIRQVTEAEFEEREGRSFTLRDALRQSNRPLARVMERSDREGELARYIEEQLTCFYNAHPHAVLSDLDFLLAQHAYACADAPFGERDVTSRQHTRQKEQQLLLEDDTGHIRAIHLPIPAALTAFE